MASAKLRYRRSRARRMGKPAAMPAASGVANGCAPHGVAANIKASMAKHGEMAKSEMARHGEISGA